jgi:hypothetical protein
MKAEANLTLINEFKENSMRTASKALESTNDVLAVKSLLESQYVLHARLTEKLARLKAQQDFFKSLCVNPTLAQSINKHSHHKDSEWLGTCQAAIYCAHITGRVDLNWYSILQENRRTEQVVDKDMGSVFEYEQKTPKRGNQHKLGFLPFTDYKGSVFYRRTDLEKWLSALGGKLPSPKIAQ